MTESSQSKARRNGSESKFRFSLRSLLAGLVLLGVLLSFYTHRRRQHAALIDRSTEFYQALSGGDMAAAYAFMSPNYIQSYTADEFVAGRGFTDLECKSPVAYLSLTGNKASLYEYENGAFDLYSGYVHYWTREGGVWYFTGQSDMFLD